MPLKFFFYFNASWYYDGNSYSKHTHAHAFKLNWARTLSLTHYLWSNSLLANRLLYNSMRPSYYIYCMMVFFFCFRLDVRQFPHMDSLKKNIKPKTEKKKIQKVHIWYMTKCRKWWNISWRAHIVYTRYVYLWMHRMMHKSESNMRHILSSFLLFVSHSPVFFFCVCVALALKN